MPRGKPAARQTLRTRIDDWSIENKGQTFKTENSKQFIRLFRMMYNTDAVSVTVQ
jgi:hypothetical protein